MSELKDVFSSTVRWFNDRGIRYQASALCESTSQQAKEGAFSTPPLFVYVAAQQTHGKGRGDHTWSSPPEGSGLMATWAFDVNKAPQHLTAPLTGLHVYRALTAVWPTLPWSLKPPNDLYLGLGKVGGLLVETVSRGDSYNLLIGFGLNVLNVPLHVPEATCISDQLDEKITEPEWHSFLQILNSSLIAAVQESHRHELGEELSEEITAAVKRHPHHQELQRVTSDGDLIYSDRTVDWFTL